MVARLVAETGSQDEGEAGGSGFSADQDVFVADSVHHLVVPDMDVAETIRAAVDQMLKFYDDRYEATLTLREG